MPKLRYQPPERLQGATDYSKHDALRGSLNTVRLVKQQAWASNQLRNDCDLTVNHGRKREDGQWELAAVAFVASRQVDLQPWWDESTDEVWRECGFKNGKPPYHRVWERMRELGEMCDEAFLDAAALVIRRCRAHDPRVLAHVHVDSTEDETHAALVHDCQPGESCARAEDDGSGSSGKPAQGSTYRPQRAPTMQAREQREEWNEEDPAEAEQHARDAEPEATEDIDKGKRIRVGGCWFRTRDREAGTRAYTRKGKTTRFWHGYYSAKAVDAYTSGVIPSVDPANKQEYDVFPELMDRVCKMTGATPQTVTGDKGYSVEKCFEYATRKGIAPVFPWRDGNNYKLRDHPTHDRDGVMRCKHCGGEMKQKRFAIENKKTRPTAKKPKKKQAGSATKKKGTPWLWFKCAAPRLPECEGEQRIRCETDWRSLIPLSRLDPLYQELRRSHYEYEGAHDYWRDRYRVAADNLTNRPKVVSLKWHRLRANVACLIDWLRIASVCGWLGTTRKLVSTRRHEEAGVLAVKAIADRRLLDGLDLPYGPQAKRLGLGEATPPSDRTSGAPPGQ
jgi:Transposase DDE domain